MPIIFMYLGHVFLAVFVTWNHANYLHISWPCFFGCSCYLKSCQLSSCILAMFVWLFLLHKIMPIIFMYLGHVFLAVFVTWNHANYLHISWPCFFGCTCYLKSCPWSSCILAMFFGCFCYLKSCQLSSCILAMFFWLFLLLKTAPIIFIYLGPVFCYVLVALLTLDMLPGRMAGCDSIIVVLSSIVTWGLHLWAYSFSAFFLHLFWTALSVAKYVCNCFACASTLMVWPLENSSSISLHQWFQKAFFFALARHLLKCCTSCFHFLSIICFFCCSVLSFY